MKSNQESRNAGRKNRNFLDRSYRIIRIFLEENQETTKPGKSVNLDITLADIRKKINQESRKLGHEDQKTSLCRSEHLSCFPGFLIH
jgi:hypothetical protein